MSIKLIAADLDGTLAESKQAISPEMAAQICGLLKNYKFAVISGGPYQQFVKQIVSKLTPDECPECREVNLQNLFLLPENGSSLYIFDPLHKEGSKEGIKDGTGWHAKYRDLLPLETKEKIFKAFDEMIAEAKANGDIDPAAALYGPQIEDRGGQITFSALGQEAPVEAKAPWDPDAKKRTKMAEKLRALIPECDIHIGGMTSIDITRKGIDKAYAIGRINEFLDITKEDVLFFGDALFPGGNDEPVEKLGVRTVKVTKPADTIEAFSKINQGIV